MDSVLSDEVLDLTIIKKIKTCDLLPQVECDSEPVPAPVSVSPADKLCEDELSLILSNVTISTRDLFNFRLVNKSWCDAATSTLLRKDASFVPLGSGIRVLPHEDEDDDRHGSEPKPRSLLCKLGIQTKTTKNIKKLIVVMSHSKRFPSSSFHLYTRGWACENLIDSPGFIPFLTLHGKHIQTLSLHGYLHSNFSLDVILVHTPNLKCLNLSEAQLFRAQAEDERNNYTNEIASPSSLTLKNLPIQSVFLGSSPFMRMSDEIVHELLCFPPKLTSIENVILETFPLVLEQEKGSLIRSFLLRYDGSATNFTGYTSAMEQLAGIQPKLSTLTLDLRNTDFYLATFNFINQIINSSKHTIENLRIYKGPGNKLKIPPMANLKCISIGGNSSYFSMENRLNPGNLSIWELEENVLAEHYFPNLLHVSLDFHNAEDQNVILPLFQFKPHKYEVGDRPENSLFKVETLKIKSFLWPDVWKAPFFHQVFPNIRFLKTSWDWYDPKNFNCSFWVMCPLVEVIEITNISRAMIENRNVSAVDSFFTGFPIGLCRKLLTTEFPVHMNNVETWNFLRAKPSILDLQYLKEFKLKFNELPCFEFASHITGNFAFSLMPNTTFTIVYDPESVVVPRHTVSLPSKHHSDENWDNESGSIGDDRSRSSKSRDDQSRSGRSCSRESGDDHDRSRSSRSCDGESDDNQNRRNESGDDHDQSHSSKSCGSGSGDDRSRRSRSCDGESDDNQNRRNESGDDHDQSHSSKSCGSGSGDDRSRRSRSCSGEGGNARSRSRSSSSKNYSSESDDDSNNGNDRNVDDDVELCFAFIKPYVQIVQKRKLR